MDIGNRKETYLSVMTASLEKKSELLEQLILLSKEQERLFSSEKLDEELFDLNLEEKDKRIQKILELDEGFEQIYQYLKEELTANKGSYQKEIKKLQELITVITDRGVEIQVIERRNKSRMEAYFRTKRKEIKDFKLSSNTVSSYYKNMAEQSNQSYFFDKKK